MRPPCNNATYFKAHLQPGYLTESSFTCRLVGLVLFADDSYFKLILTMYFGNALSKTPHINGIFVYVLNTLRLRLRIYIFGFEPANTVVPKRFQKIKKSLRCNFTTQKF